MEFKFANPSLLQALKPEARVDVEFVERRARGMGYRLGGPRRQSAATAVLKRCPHAGYRPGPSCRQNHRLVGSKTASGSVATLFSPPGKPQEQTPNDASPDLPPTQDTVRHRIPRQAPQVVEESSLIRSPRRCCRCPSRRWCASSSSARLRRRLRRRHRHLLARLRVLEYLNLVAGRMLKGITPQIADATGVAVYQYALIAKDKDQVAVSARAVLNLSNT